MYRIHTEGVRPRDPLAALQQSPAPPCNTHRNTHCLLWYLVRFYWYRVVLDLSEKLWCTLQYLGIVRRYVLLRTTCTEYFVFILILACLTVFFFLISSVCHLTLMCPPLLQGEIFTFVSSCYPQTSLAKSPYCDSSV